MNKQFLINYFNLDQEVKKKTKQRDVMKKDIKSFLQAQKNNSYRFENVLAYIKEQDKTCYNIPDDIKMKYQDTRTEEHVKVEVK